MQRYRSTRLLVASLALVVPVALSAQAFGLNEIGSCAIARGFAATASPCRDASTIFWNPAAATSLTGWNATVGIAAIAVSGSFDQDTTLSTFRRQHTRRPGAARFRQLSRRQEQVRLRPRRLCSVRPHDRSGTMTSRVASLCSRQRSRRFTSSRTSPGRSTPNGLSAAGPIFGHSSVELIQGVDLSAQATREVIVPLGREPYGT